MNRRHRLHFDDDAIFDDEIDSIARIERLSFVNKREPVLRDVSELARSQLELEALRIGGFEQPRPEISVHLDSCAEYLTRLLIEGCFHQHDVLTVRTPLPAFSIGKREEKSINAAIPARVN